MFNLFKKNNSEPEPQGELAVRPPATGLLVALSEVPDPVFSSGAMGPGFAVNLESDELRSPIAGEVVIVPETRHAVGLRASNGAEILVHVGVDTVGLKGDGFTVHVREGDSVASGDLLMTVDRSAIASRVPSLVTPVILTNADGFSAAIDIDSGDIPMHVSLA